MNNVDYTGADPKVKYYCARVLRRDFGPHAERFSEMASNTIAPFLRSLIGTSRPLS